MPEVFARKGEKITCTNGHTIMEIGHDLIRHARVAAADFKAIDGVAPPQRGDKMKPDCPRCHAEWWRWNWPYREIQLHFEDGWR